MAITAEEVRIIVDAKVENALKGLEQTDKKTNTLTKSLKTLVGPAAIGALVAGAVAVGKRFSELAANAEEVNSKFNTVFKDQSAAVRQWANEYADAFGQSKTDTLAFLGTIQDTLVPLGFARDAASGLSTEIVALAGDLASFNNLPTADVVRDIQSAVVGNTETLRKYGVVASQAAIEQEALDSGIIDTKRSLTAQEKAQAILNLTLKGTIDAQGDLERTQDSTANTNRRLENSLDDLGIAYGKMINDSLTPLKASLADVIAQQATLTEEANRQRDVRALYAQTAEEIENTGEATGSLAELQLKLAAAEERTTRGKISSRREAEAIVAVLKEQVAEQEAVFAAAEAARAESVALAEEESARAAQAKTDLENLEAAFSATKEGQIAALEASIEYFETFIQGPMATAVLRDLRAELEQLTAQTEEAADAQEDYATRSIQASNRLRDAVVADEEAKQAAIATTGSKGEEVSNNWLRAGTDTLNALQSTTAAYFDAQLSMYDKDSEEYKALKRKQFDINKITALADIGISTAVAAVNALKLGPIAGPIAASAITGLGLAQASFVASQQAPAFATGGDFVTNGPQMIMVGDNPGGQERVQVTPISSPNINGPSGGGRLILEFRPQGIVKPVQTLIDNQEIIIR